MRPERMPWRRTLFLAVATGIIVTIHAPCAAGAPLKEHFSLNDADAYVEVAVKTLGDGAATASDKDYAVRLLDALGNGSVAKGIKPSACTTASAGVTGGDLAGIHHGISLRVGVGCAGETASAKASGAIEQAMQKDDLRSLYYGVLSAPLVGLKMGKKTVNKVVDKVVGLLLKDGSVRSYPGGPSEDGNTLMAAEILAQLAPRSGGDVASRAKTAVDIMRDNNLDAEPGLIVPLNLAYGGMVTVRPSKLKTMARDLLEASKTSHPESMVWIYQALKAIAGYAAAPLVTKLIPASPSVEELASGDVKLQVTTLLGSPAPVKSISLSKLARSGGSDALGTQEGIPLAAPNQDGVRALPAVEVAAGFYTAEFGVDVDGKILQAKLQVAVSSTAVLAETRVAVSGSRSPPLSTDPTTVSASYTLAPGEKLPSNAQANTLDGHHLHIGFSLEGGAAAAPHQAFVRFTHVQTGLDTFFVAAPDRSAASGGGGGGGISIGRFSVSVALGEETGTFLQRSGAYEVAVIVGGPLVAPPVSETLGAINLDFPAAKERSWPLYARSLLHESDVTLEPLPEKHHTFRQPEARPPAGVSLLFTILALAPLAAFVGWLRNGGGDLRRLPHSESGRLWCLAYQASMVAVVGLFVTYWFALTMSYTLQLLAMLSLVTTWTGRQALQALVVEEKAVSAQGGSAHKKVD